MNENDRAILEKLGDGRTEANCDSEGRVRTLRTRGPCETGDLAGLTALNAVNLTGWDAVPALPTGLNALRYAYPSNGTLTGDSWERIRETGGQLTFLDLSGCGIAEMPGWFPAETPALRHVVLNGNELTTWPDLPHGTETFAARDNTLRRFPPKAALTEYDFEVLDLAGNRISELSEWVRLRKLRLLDLSRNEFTHLPSRLSAWQVMSAHVDASGNSLTDAYLQEMNSRVAPGCHSLEWSLASQKGDRRTKRSADFSGNGIDYLDEGWLELDGRNYPPHIGI